MKKEIKSFVKIDLVDSFPSQYPNKSFFNYISNMVGLEDVLSVAGIFAPDLVEENGCVFIKENYPIIENNNLYDKYKDDYKVLERYVNLFCLSDFYLMAANEASQDKFLLQELATIIMRFWEMYLNSVYPEKKFDIEISIDGLFDEDGICITFSQAAQDL